MLTINDDTIDEGADEQIRDCLQLDKPTSFFLFAGAGSGKTRSLVGALSYLCQENGRALRLRGQRVGVLTYTNAACEEIMQRLSFDPLIEVSTIHSFVWSLICDFSIDIKTWLRGYLTEAILELQQKQEKGRGGKAGLDREKSIAAKQNRLDKLVNIKQFTYNPNGDNQGKDSLNHAEVIKIGVDFLSGKPLMQKVLVTKFPVILIDESQDTNKLLLEALLQIQQIYKDKFCLGLFGDTMQRIYADGKTDLGQNLPEDWAKPVKQMNHRCPHRIVKLINDVRLKSDEKVQRPRSDSSAGSVRMFIVPSSTTNKVAVEYKAAEAMAALTGDQLWSNPLTDVKTLLLEHHMAARRMGFLEMFEPLYREDKLTTGLLNGSLSGLRLFSNIVLPLVKAKQAEDDFAIASIVRKYSPLLRKANLLSAQDQPKLIRQTREAVEQLLALWTDSAIPRFIDVLQCVHATGLFEIPDSLLPIALRNESEQQLAQRGPDMSSLEDGQADAIDAWDKFLLVPFNQIESYVSYVDGFAAFSTHQGIKGLEFPRVMVIIDDSEARGFSFSYDKLFGAKGKSDADIKNEREGKETGIERTKRLFYVTCSRAKESLAIVAYSSHPETVKSSILAEGWFTEDELEVLTL